MTIEIHQPELEALIQQRMASGRFGSVEDLLLQTLATAPEEPHSLGASKQNLTQFLKQSPLWGSGLTVERRNDSPRPVEL